MSYDIGLNKYTELELSTGAYRIIEGEHCYCDSLNKDELCSVCERRSGVDKNSAYYERYRFGAKIIAGRSKSSAMNLLVKRMYHESINSAISRYFKVESIPEYYLPIIRNRSCLEIVVKGIIFKVCKVPHCTSISHNLEVLCQELYENKSRDTAYDRVSYIRSFIYKVIDDFYGQGYSSRIPVLPMKNALSVSRLRLNVVDIEEGGLDYFQYINNISENKSETERLYPSVPRQTLCILSSV